MTPAIASNGRQYLDAVLGIDIGSTQTRMVVAWDDGSGIQKRIIENREDAYTPLNTLAQFASRVLVHDDKPNKYIGNATQAHREESSAKFIPYILTSKNERLLDQYLILERLWAERRKVGRDLFHQRLEEAFDQFLCFVLKRAKCALETYSSNDKQIRIKTVAMTIPSQWDLNFEEVYRQLFKRAFLQTFNDVPHMATHDFSIVFHTEATALAHYIFHESSHEAALGGGMPRIGTILKQLNAQCLIDCGGHNGNSIVTQFHPNKDGQAVLYELGKAQGAGGGSEMLFHHLMNRLVDDYRVQRNDQADLPQSFYQALKHGITTSLRSFTQEARQFVTCESPRGLGQPVVLEINREMCEEAFQAGFKHVKDMIESQLQELARISQGWGATDHIVTVIVSGGSSMHPELIKWIRAACTRLSLPAPVFTSAMEIHNGPARIAMGAAYASLTSESVESFAEKCAFGLQKGIVKNQGEDDEHLDLEGSAATIWYQEGIIPVTVDATGDQAEYRIVCEPVLASYRANLPTDRNVAQGASYDFLNIGTLPGGHKHRIEFTLNAEEEQVELKIHRIEKPLSAKLKNYARQVAKKEKVLCLGPFPVHVQPGTRCLVIQKSTDEIDEQIATAMEEYREDSEYDDTDRDETYSDDSYQDDTRGDDTDTDDSDSDDNYSDNAGNEIVPGSPHPPSGLDNSHHAPGPSSSSSISHSQNSAIRGGASGRDNEAKDDDDDVGQDVPKKKRKNRRPRRSAKHKQKRMVEHEQMVLSPPEQAHEQSNQATTEPEQVQDQQSPSLDLADVARHAGASNTAASNTARNISKAPAINASNSSKHATFSNGCRIASKAETARVTSNAFRSSREVSGRAASNSQTGFGVPRGILTSTPTARPVENMGHHRSDNMPSTRDALFSSYMGSSSMAPGSQGGPSARNKRPAPPEDNNSRPTKRYYTSAEPSSSTAAYPGQHTSRPEPGRDPLTSYSAAQNSSAFENRRDAPVRRGNGDYYRPSTDTARFPGLAAPSRRPVGSRDYLFSNRYRDQDPESSVRHGLAELNLNHGVSASGSQPRGPAPAAPPHRRDTAAPRAAPAGNLGSWSLPVDSPRPGPSSRPAPESSPAGSLQHRRRFGPKGSEKRGGYPPSSD